MRIRRRGILGSVTGLLLVLVVLALEVVGCNKPIRPAEWSELRLEGDEPKALRIVPRSNKDVADLSPDDIVRVMRRVGLSDEQVLELGTDLYSALLTSGAATIINGKDTEAVFVVNGKHLFVRTRLHSSFIYDIGGGRFGLLPPPPKGGR